MKPKRSRTVRREQDREVEKLIEAREKLAKLEVGGTLQRPIEVQTASVIETRAVSFPCLRCEGALRVHEHRAISAGHDLRGHGGREVELACKACGAHRTLYFRVVMPS